MNPQSPLTKPTLNPEHMNKQTTPAPETMNKQTTSPTLVEGYIDGVEILHATISIGGEVHVESLDLGSVTLNCEGREYKLDITDSCWDVEDGCTEISCGLTTTDEYECFEDCKFDLTAEDLFSSDLTGTIFIGDDYLDDTSITPDFISATLWIKYGFCTKAIELAFE